MTSGVTMIQVCGLIKPLRVGELKVLRRKKLLSRRSVRCD
jgi:hypothetical protein